MKTEPRFEVNNFTGEDELIVDATIISISKKPLVNSNGTEYLLLKVIATMPDGNEESFTTCLWQSLQDMLDLQKEDDILVAIQLFGDGAGYSKVFLDGAVRPDVSAYAEMSLSKNGKLAPIANVANTRRTRAKA